MINKAINIANGINVKNNNYSINNINNNLIHTNKNTSMINNTSNNNIEEIDLTNNNSNKNSNLTFYDNTSGASSYALDINSSKYYSFDTSTSKGKNGLISIKKEALKNLDVDYFNNIENHTKKSDSHGEYTYFEKNGVTYKHYNSYDEKKNYNVAQLKDGMELIFNNNKLTSITNNKTKYTLKTPTDNIFKTITFDFITLNNEGNFDKFADMQEIDLSFLYVFNNSAIKKEWIEKKEGYKNIINKTINELYEISKGDDKEVFERLKNNGLGKLKIIESYNDNASGFNAVVLQDTDGNYMINYPGTEAEFQIDENIITAFNTLIEDLQNLRFINNVQEYKEHLNKLYDAFFKTIYSAPDVLYDANNILYTREVLTSLLKPLLKSLIKNLQNDANKEIQNQINQYNFTNDEYWDLALPYLLTISQEKYNSLSSKFAKAANNQSNLYLKFINWWQSGFCSIFGLKDDISADVSADVATNTITSITNFIKINEIVKKINQNQKDLANGVAQRYYEQAKTEGKKLNISGFSLGGSLAERSYLNLINTKSDTSNTLNKITLHNPYHDDLNEAEVKTLKEHNIELFCNDGDPISAIFNQEDFKDIAKYINVNYKAKIKKISQPYINQDDSEKNIITQYSEIARLAIYELHTVNPEYKIAYDKFGNVIKKDIKPKTIDQIITDLNNELSK